MHRIKNNAINFFHKTNLAQIPVILLFGSLLVFSWLLMFHTFSYDNKAYQILISPKVWSDFGAHLPLIRSFSMGGNWELLTHGRFPQYPIFPGEPIRYHFLFYLFVGLLERFGMRIDYALNLPSIFGFFLLLSSIFLLSYKLFKRLWVSILSVLFFILNGSLSFLSFLEKHPFQSLADTINTILHNTDFPSFAPWGPGNISAFWNLNIYTNQRHLALAFALIFWFMLSILNAPSFTKKKFILFVFVWTMVLTLMPFFHQPMLLVFAVVIFCSFLLFPKSRSFLLATGVLGGIMVLAQYPLLPPGKTGITLHPGYLAQTLKIDFLVKYWFENIGLHLILIPIGFLLAPRDAKKLFIPIFIVFITANLFQFAREMAANHKFINLFMLYGNLYSAYAIYKTHTFINNQIAAVFKYLDKHIHTFANSFIRLFVYSFIRLLEYSFIGLLLFFLTFSGVIDLFAVFSDTPGRLDDVKSNPAAYFIRSHTPASAVFLNNDYLYNPASIAGRFIYLGWPYFSWSAGYDTDNRFRQLKEIFASDNIDDVCSQTQDTFDYILINKLDPNPDLPTVSGFYDTLPSVYRDQQKNVNIINISQICNNR